MTKPPHGLFYSKITIIFCIFNSNSDSMSDKNTTNINLAEKMKKLESRQETVLVGIEECLTEEDKSNITLTIGKKGVALYQHQSRRT